MPAYKTDIVIIYLSKEDKAVTKEEEKQPGRRWNNLETRPKIAIRLYNISTSADKSHGLIQKRELVLKISHEILPGLKFSPLGPSVH